MWHTFLIHSSSCSSQTWTGSIVHSSPGTGTSPRASNVGVVDAVVSKHPILLRALDPEGGVRVCTDEEYLTFVAGITALLQVAEVAVSLGLRCRGEGRVCRDDVQHQGPSALVLHAEPSAHNARPKGVHLRACFSPCCSRHWTKENPNTLRTPRAHRVL